MYAVATQDTIDIWLKSDPIRGKAVDTIVLDIVNQAIIMLYIAQQFVVLPIKSSQKQSNL